MRLFPEHTAKHTSDIGFEDLSNGRLIAEAARQFEVLVTTDKNIRFEHNLDKLPISILELKTKFTRLEDLQTLVAFLDEALQATKTYRFVSVGPDGRIERLAPKEEDNKSPDAST
jgi:hypothetical protein